MESLGLLIVLGIAFLASSLGALYLWWHYATPQNRKLALVKAIGQGAVVLNRDHVVEVANAAAGGIWQTTGLLLEGKPFSTLIKGDWPQDALTQQREIDFTAVLDNNSTHVYQIHMTSLSLQKDEVAYLATITLTPTVSGKQKAHSSAVANQLFSIANYATRAPEMRHTAPAILKTVLDTTEAEGGSLLILDRQQLVTTGISMSRGSNQIRMMDEETMGQATKQGFVQEVLQTKERLIISDMSASRKWQHLYSERTPIRSILVVPLILKQDVKGILTLTHTKVNRFGGDQVQLFNAGGALLAQLLKGSQQYEAQVSLTARQKTIDQILRMVGKPTDPTELAQQIVTAVSDRANWMMVAILTPRPDKELLTVTALKTRLYMQNNYDLPFDQSISGRAFTSGETQLTSNEQNGTGTIEQPPMVSLICVPLMQGEKKLGVLTIGSDRQDAFNEQEVVLAESIGDAVAVTLTNARFHDQVNQYVNNLTALFDATKRISRLLDIDEILQEALDTAIRFTGFEAGLISLEEQGQTRLVLAYKSGMNRFAANFTADMNLSDTVSGMVYQRAKYILLENALFPSFTRKTIEKNQPEAMQLLRDMGYVAYAGSPLLYQNKALGTLCLFNSTAKTLSEEERSVHLALAQQTAAMVANARLVDTIRGERQRLRTVIQSSHEGIVVIGNEWEVMVLNETAVNLLGVVDEPEMWLGRHVRHLIKPLRESQVDIFSAIRAAQQTAIKEGESVWRGTTQRDDLFLDWVCVPVQSGETVLGSLIVLYDVSESHQLQQLREELVYTMVHDLRNPIGIANMSAQYFRNRFYDEWEDDDREVLEGIESSLDKSLNLITSILEISRLEDKSMPVTPDWVEPGYLLTQALIKQEPLARQKDIALDLLLPDQLPLVWADTDLIERVMQNLVDNALKFTPAGGDVTIKAEHIVEASLVYISISDTGSGIPDGVKLFHKFSKGGQEGAGSGLGLAFCKMALDAHGQSIWVSQAVTTPGTTLTFSLAAQVEGGEYELYITDGV